MNSATDITTVVTETMESNQTTVLRTVSPLILRVVTEESEFFSLRNEWDRLVIESSATIYQTHEWASLWWVHFGKQSNHSLYCITLYHDNVLVGIVPLYQERLSMIGIPIQRRLGMMGEGTEFSTSFGMFFDNGPTDYLDAMISPGYESLVGQSVVQHFVSHPDDFDVIHFVNAPHEGMVLTSIVPNLQRGGMSCTVSKADVCPYLSAPASIEEYLKNMNSSVRRRLSQAKRAASTDGMFTISEATTLDEHKLGLENIINLHQRRWNRNGYPGLFADTRFREFQFGLLQAFHEFGWVWCKTANVDGKCIAARLAFKFNGRFYDYLSGFDDGAPAAKRRPGLALLLEMIEDCIQASSKTIDFLRGDEQYKFEMTSSSRYNWNVTVQNKSLRSNLGSKIQKMFLGARLGIFLVRRELSLVGVQYREHGLLKATVKYIQFRSPRLSKKLAELRSKK